MGGEAGEVLNELTQALEEIRELSRIEGFEHYLAADRAVLLLRRLAELCDPKPSVKVEIVRTYSRVIDLDDD
jgi:hypothetical protein